MDFGRNNFVTFFINEKIEFIFMQVGQVINKLELYKKYKYNPFLDTLPLLLQIPIVLGLVGVVYRPLSFILPA